ncbi:MAG: HAD-IA family hydrolase [Actinomycetia bacterium]|nr:HAD-IA family hydrolase [Actinomycetes bacterium]
MVIKAALFDFGGVVTTSPFEAFARYEEASGLPVGLIRSINSTDPDDNAWAKLERNDVDADGFAHLFEAEARDRGHAVSGHTVLDLLAGEVRPQMVEAIGRIRAAGFAVACLTNNFKPRSEADDARPDIAAVMAMFDVVVESSVVGIRKPELAFYHRALSMLGVEANEAVFLDDLGINLKPARAMGITPIKVVDAEDALGQLSTVLGLELLG